MHGRPSPAVIADRIAALSDRMRSVYVDEADALYLIGVYASQPQAVIYCDPPYPTASPGKYDARIDHEAFQAAVSGAEAAVMVSGVAADCPVLDADPRWRAVTIPAGGRGFTPAGQRSAVREETLWVNYPISGQLQLLAERP